MRIVHQTAVFTVTLLIGSTSPSQRPTPSQTGLDDERIQIYRVFWQGYAEGKLNSVNLANTTSSFDLYGTREGKGCLKGITSGSLSQARSIVHTIGSDVLMDSRIRLVDPTPQSAIIKQGDPGLPLLTQGAALQDAVKQAFASGMLSLSEIAFDKQHRRAVMSYSFTCGSLCGHGGVEVFVRTSDGGWKSANRKCGSWIS